MRMWNKTLALVSTGNVPRASKPTKSSCLRSKYISPGDCCSGFVVQPSLNKENQLTVVSLGYDWVMNLG